MDKCWRCGEMYESVQMVRIRNNSTGFLCQRCLDEYTRASLLGGGGIPIPIGVSSPTVEAVARMTAVQHDLMERERRAWMERNARGLEEYTNVARVTGWEPNNPVRSRQGAKVEDFARKAGISSWDASKLSKFCEIGYDMARKQFRARLDAMNNDFSNNQKVVDALLEELAIVTENLIVVALKSGTLSAAKLRGKSDAPAGKKATRNLILTEEE